MGDVQGKRLRQSRNKEVWRKEGECTDKQGWRRRTEEGVIRLPEGYRDN